MMKRTIGIVALACLVQVTGLQAQMLSQSPEIDTSMSVADTTEIAMVTNDSVTVVYYFHGEKRCVTCRKIEALAEKSLRDGFDSALVDSSVQWRVVNFEDEGNEHFAKTYKLFSQTLIVSCQVDGEEVGWKNLDKIWQLVHDEDEFLTYVQAEVRAPWGTEQE